MRKKQIKIILGAIFILFLSPNLISAQDNQPFRINEELWEKEVEKCIFNTDEIDAPKQEIRDINDENNFNPSTLIPSLTIFAYIFIGILFVLILMATIQSGVFKGNKRIKDKSEWLNKLEAIEENLKDNDLEQFIKQALKDQAWDVAIRLQYLSAIQALNRANFIVWKKQKTNGQYLKELKGKVVSIDFKKATYIFEYVWYSNTDFSLSDLKAYYKEIKTNVDAITNETKKEDHHG